MVFQVQEMEEDGDHGWAVVQCSCDLTDENDELVTSMVGMVRDAYGENEIVAIAQRYEDPDPAVARRFDVTAIMQAVRQSLPNPNDEGNKPAHLTNFRSETAEMVAKGVLASTHSVTFPTAPQRGKVNANQPILGFDGWGILGAQEANCALVLIQVKGTDDERRPPGEAMKLAEECKRVPRQPHKLSRVLAVMVTQLDESPLQQSLLCMLETIGQNMLPPLVVAPVIVRGQTPPHRHDLEPVRAAASEFAPAIGRGVTVSISANLTDFGRMVMARARQI
jgi:hypothetical protein